MPKKLIKNIWGCLKKFIEPQFKTKIGFRKNLGFQKSNKFQKIRTETTTFLEQICLKKNWDKKIWGSNKVWVTK